MAKAGANVIKIEPPNGEPLRARERVGGGASLPMAMLNSNKRAITLNLKHPRGVELLRALARQADVVIENFSPGVMDRLGVGADALMRENPRLIYASATGYGLSGPERDNLAMDITIQAAAGVISVTGFPDGPPVKAGPAIADFLSGTHLYGAIATALFERERTGTGRMIEIAMVETLFPTLASNLGATYLKPGRTIGRTGNRHGGLAVAPYNVYACKDGYFSIICQSEGHWRSLLKAMAKDDLIDDPRFANNAARVKHMAETDALVEDWAKALTRDEIFALTQEHRVPSAPVRDLSEVVANAHMHERGMLEEIDHPKLGRITVPNSPLRYRDTPQMKSAPSPELGQHNDEIYGGILGLSPAEIASLRKEGAI
jgi:crotonobetainyl-CoA:carnitine CoA-transferase CaiB-like acyl-CoA transferase